MPSGGHPAAMHNLSFDEFAVGHLRGTQPPAQKIDDIQAWVLQNFQHCTASDARLLAGAVIDLHVNPLDLQLYPEQIFAIPDIFMRYTYGGSSWDERTEIELWEEQHEREFIGAIPDPVMRRVAYHKLQELRNDIIHRNAHLPPLNPAIH